MGEAVKTERKSQQKRESSTGKRNDIAAYNTSQVDGDRIKSGRKRGVGVEREAEKNQTEKVGHPSKFRTARHARTQQETK